MRRRKSSRIGAVAAGAVLAVTLTACGGGTPGAAAVVDGRTIPVSDVDAAIADLGPLLGNSPAGAVMSLALASTYREAAASVGVVVSEQEAREAFPALAEASLASDPSGDLDAEAELSAASVTILRTSLEINAINASSEETISAATEFLVAALAEVDIDLNPRYGQLTEDLQVAASSYPWIVPTVEDPVAQ